MKFTLHHVFREERFALGIEETTGKRYLAIPVSNPYVDYEEYCEIDSAQFEVFPQNLNELRDIAARSRARQNDDRLLMKPGGLRGTPT